MKSLLLIGLLGTSTQASSADLFTAVSGNYPGRIEDSDYGTSEGTGGSIIAIGAAWSLPDPIGVPIESRVQKSLQSTAWNDNKETGAPQFRDGYAIESTELLLGTRLPLFSPQIDTSVLFGAGRSEITYRTRENLKGNPTAYGKAIAVRHLTAQWDIRYKLPIDHDQLEVGLLGMLRISLLERHNPDLDVARVTWNMNVPTLPLPSLGLVVSTKL